GSGLAIAIAVAIALGQGQAAGQGQSGEDEGALHWLSPTCTDHSALARTFNAPAPARLTPAADPAGFRSGGLACGQGLRHVPRQTPWRRSPHASLDAPVPAPFPGLLPQPAPGPAPGGLRTAGAGGTRNGRAGAGARRGR